LLFIEPLRQHTKVIATARRRIIGPYGLDHQRENELIAAGLSYDVDRLLSIATLPTERSDNRIEPVTADIQADPCGVFRTSTTAS
jgi:hypothetical protein